MTPLDCTTASALERLLSQIQSLSEPSPSTGSLLRRLIEFLSCAVGEHPGFAIVSNNGLAPRQWQVTAQFCPHQGIVSESSQLFLADAKAPYFKEALFDPDNQTPAPRTAKPLPASLRTQLGESAANYQAALALPIFVGGTVENWMLLLHPKADGFEEVDLGSLTAMVNLAAAFVVRMTDVAELRRANAWIERELDEIANIQWTLLPRADRVIPGMRSAYSYNTFAQAGGDYLDLVPLRTHPEADTESDSWGAIIADAAGHGASAAVEAAMLDAILRTYSGRVSDGPACVLNYLNRHLFTRRIRGTFITTFIVNFHRATRVLRYSNAGHPPILLKSAADPTRITPLTGGDGIPLGVDKAYVWSDEQRTLEFDDLLFFYTDGVVETRNDSNEDFGLHRLNEVLASAPNDPQKLVDEVQQALIAFRGNERSRDDFTLLAVQVKPD